MKRYLVFTGQQYYPHRAWHDFMGAAETLEEAQQIALDHADDWYQIVDLTTLKVVAHGSSGLYRS